MRFRIKHQILLIAMIPVLLIDAFFTYVLIKSNIDQAEQLLQSKGEIIAQQIASASEFGLLTGSYEQIRRLLEQSINTNNIIFIAVYNIDGSIIARTVGSDYQPLLSTEYSYYRQNIQTHPLDTKDIFEPGKPTDTAISRNLGWVHMYISKQQLQMTISRIFKEGAFFFFAMLLLAILLTLSISRRITRPVYSLLNHLNRIETGHLGDIINPLEANEIGDVQKGFNSMSQALLANRRQLDEKIKSATIDLRLAVSDLEKNNYELALARDTAQKADKVKTQFLANMSHEIRTPINGIQGFLTLLFKTGLSQEQLRYADIITQSTRDLSNIVNEILDFSKIESGKIELINTPFDLHELVESTRDSLFASTIEKNIDLYLSIYSDTPKMLTGDKYRLKQILINLIGNAIKFTDQGFVSITVIMEDESAKKAMIRFDIEDSGIGINIENQKTLFKAFKQIESDINRRFTGTGLGLAISKNLAILMGGMIQLTSQPNRGSLFSLLLPFDKVPAQNDTADSTDHSQTVLIYAFNERALSELQSLYNRAGFNVEAELIKDPSLIDRYQKQLMQNLSYIDFIVFDLRHSSLHPDQLIPQKAHQQCLRVIVMHYDPSLVKLSSYADYQFISVINSSNKLHSLMTQLKSDPAPEPALANVEKPSQHNAKNILIVDDNAINLALACELTRIWGHLPTQANNARAAMQLFKVQSFDLILLDIQMPEIDGIELMQMMRNEQPELCTRIIAITANVLEKEQERLLNLGFDGYISKPIEEQKLKNLLDHQQPVSTVKPQTDAPTGALSSLDFAQTLKLCANQEKLVISTFTMLQQELPDYKNVLNFAIGSVDLEKIGAIMHILHGVVCYAALPALSQLLKQYEALKDSHEEVMVLQLASQVNSELKAVEQALKQFIDSKADCEPSQTPAPP
ncbi:MAG: response regulator [Gammaproteobacteria bacterium]|nr:response regulator [Gammaproteobacteria bacterium]